MLTLLALIGLAAVCSAAPEAPQKPMNVLYIVCDDFRPQIGGYNISDPARIPTPNLDKLIAGSTLFKRAYVQQAVCGPSRNSFPVSRRPQNTKVWNFQNDFRKTNSSWLTTPQWFKEQEGYLVNGNGKFFHPGHPAHDDEPYSWTQPADGGWAYQDPNHQIFLCDDDQTGHKPLSCVIDEEETVDFVLSNLTQTRLEEIAGRGGSQPFMQVVGHLKPHPFWALPQWAFDMFPLEDVPLPAVGTFVSNMEKEPEPSYYACDSVNARTNLTSIGAHLEPYNPIPDEPVKYARQGYFAGIVHLDRMIGATLDKLEALGLENDTLIVLHADHGWELGERGSFCKMSIDELRTRVPLIIRDPSRPQSHGKVIEEPTEILNVFPTIVELATGVPLEGRYEVDGISIASVLDDPSSPVPPPRGFSEALAFSVYPRCLDSKEQYPVPQGYNVTDDPCIGVASSMFTHMGLSVRSKSFRYTEWREWDGSTLTPRFDVAATQITLFDHREDAGTSFDNMYERFNSHGMSEFAEVEATMAGYVEQMWKK